MNEIKIKNISKNFGDTKALNNVSINLEPNKIYGLLGRNGAGKTTLLNIINNRLFPNEGTITLNGENVFENDNALSNFFYTSENLLYPENMKVKDAFKWSKHFFPQFNMEYAYTLVNKFNLPVKKKITALSTGYTSIFKNIIALSVNTPYVFLDEPVLGLDANHRELFYKCLIEKYSDNPFTAVISTHLIEEAANLIENVIIIKNGEVIKNDSKDNLISNAYMVAGPLSTVDSYISDKNVIGTDILGGLKTAYIIGTTENVPENLEISKMDLQKLFIQLTNI